MSTVEDEPPRGPTEHEKFQTFVAERFEKLGFNVFQAERLVELHADWHEADRLIGRGCDVDVAFDILT